MMKQGRIKWLDVVRSIAIIAVVMCHVVEGSIYEFSVEYMNALDFGTSTFAIIAFTFGRLGVPLFLLISGYLLLDKEYDNEACIKFWKNKWLGLIIATEVWIILYNLFFYFYSGREINVLLLGKEVLFLRLAPMSHMWYMPMIVGMYLTLPIAANALHKLETKTILFPFVILSLVFLGIPAANVVLQTFGVSMGQTALSIGYSGGVYGL